MTRAEIRCPYCGRSRQLFPPGNDNAYRQHCNYCGAKFIGTWTLPSAEELEKLEKEEEEAET